MFDFLQKLWGEKRITKERLKNYIPLFISNEEYETIINISQD